MARRIKITWAQSRYLINRVDGIRLRIEATEAEEMPVKIFAYLTMPLRPGAGDPVGVFDHICSPVDLEEYPEDEPIAGHQPGWFRLDYVDVLLRSAAEIEAALAAILDDVRSLKHTLDTMDDTEPTGEVWIDEEAATSSSSEGSSEGGG